MIRLQPQRHLHVAEREWSLIEDGPRGTWCVDALERMGFPYELPPLPYPLDALSPFVSASTLEAHYAKHHQAYIDALNKAIEDSEFQPMPLRALMRATAGRPEREAMFNNAAQAWNHAFYWDSLDPKGGGRPPAVIATMMEAAFGSVEDGLRAWAEAAMTPFGSGWAWLVLNGKKLDVVSTVGADNPLSLGMTPLLAIDVWEHAYCPDYQNRRREHIAAVVGHLANWNFAVRNLA